MSGKPVYTPGNAWGPVLDAIGTEPATRFERQAALERVRYHKDLSPEIISIFERLISEGGGQDGDCEKLNTPADLTRNRSGAVRLPFRRLNHRATHPSPYPFDLALPRLAGVGNDVWPFHLAAPVLHTAAGVAAAPKLLVLYSLSDPEAARFVLGGLARQRGSAALEVVVCAPGAPEGLAGKISTLYPGARLTPHDITSPETAALVDAALDAVDGVAFLSGACELDIGLFDRAGYLLRISDKIVQALCPMTGEELTQPTPFAMHSVNVFDDPYPYRRVEGLNFLAPTRLLRQAGGLNPRFAGPYMAAKELAWRCFNLGAWFSPLPVRRIEAERRTGDEGPDAELFRTLCPSPADRPADGRYEVPRVSVYIPAYNCAKYIERAVGSVLDQDFQDLEVCLAIDGSPDNTMEVLARAYGDDPRVRFEDGANGGIGHASNRAIRMGQGMYVGQLDSDDCLAPGAVRRLATYLDENPDIACCYGSCERIDASGAHIQMEYSWPQFTREKMLISSIAHHFRMFRRAAWERTETFRSDIINAVDYDIFMKLMDTGGFHHIDDVLYQRRWHGENTSDVNEGFQTTNTHRVQREALKRMGLDRFWDVYVPNSDDPRRITYRRDPKKPRVMFWPDYSRSNAYQHLLYQELAADHEVFAAPVAAAVKLIKKTPHTGPLIFHLHWTNFLFIGVTSTATARAKADNFLKDLRYFRKKGGRVVWTIHNLVSHESPFLSIEKDLIRQIIDIADVLHFHSAASIPEIETQFALPKEKIRIAPHGAYEGVYADHIDREAARDILGFAPDDQVILHTGQVRAYKGAEDLVATFRALLPDNPKLRLVIAGEFKFDTLGALDTPLSEVEAARVTIVERFLDDTEFQLFYRAANVAAFPYKSILTSGSMLLALSFGVPVAIPAVGMTREVLGDGKGGIVYDPADPKALETTLLTLLAKGEAAQTEAKAKAQTICWTGIPAIFHELTA